MSDNLGVLSGPGETRIVLALQDIVRNLGASQQVLAGGLTVNTSLLVTTAASLPATAPLGQLRFASNGRNPGEGGGAGTGCVVVGNGAGVWKSVWSGVAVTV